jgi:hypothetical protein
VRVVVGGVEVHPDTVGVAVEPLVEPRVGHEMEPQGLHVVDRGQSLRKNKVDEEKEATDAPEAKLVFCILPGSPSSIRRLLLFLGTWFFLNGSVEREDP